jgi:hypothetical protein
MIPTRFPMMSLCHDSVADDENCSNGGIRAGLTKRLLCLVECRAHELFVPFSIHRFEKSIVALAG